MFKRKLLALNSVKEKEQYRMRLNARGNTDNIKLKQMK